MQSTKKILTDTTVTLSVTADAKELQDVKTATLNALAKDVKVQGFRGGKAPLPLIEKQISPAVLQNEFLERALNGLYVQALDEHDLRPVAQPELKITKFVPFSTLEFTATVEIVGAVKLPDYKKIKLAPEKVSVSAKDIDEVLHELATRDAEKKDVDRAAKEGDQVWIDFTGVDAKTKEPIKGADGQGYPLNLGSNTFIPGFETNLIGLKTGEEKTFTLTFPKDYGVKALQNRKVTFTAKVTKVQEVVTPTFDDAFAAKIGPFKSLADLKEDIKKQVLSEKEYRADQAFTNNLITTLAEKSKVAIPQTLIDEQLDRLENEQRQNLTYRGQTWQEFLEAQGLTDKTYRDSLLPQAELRIKAGLILSDIAELEQITVSREELEEQLAHLKEQYKDPAMQAELAKKETRREIASRILTDKTVAKLKQYATA